MRRIRILFYHAAIDGKAIDNLIAFWTGLWPSNWGTRQFSHMEIEFCDRTELPNGEIGFSTIGLDNGLCFSSATRGGKTGVRFAPSSEVLKHPERWWYLEKMLPDEIEQKMFNEASKIIGAKYDYFAILGYCAPQRILSGFLKLVGAKVAAEAIEAKLQDSKKWYCSEVVNHVLWKGSLLDKSYRWSPRATSRLIEKMYWPLKRLSSKKVNTS